MDNQADRQKLLGLIIDIGLKLGIVLILLLWGFFILRPFLIPIIWGIILAVACSPLCDTLTERLGNRRKFASAVVTVLLILALIVPCLLLADSLIASVQSVTASVNAGELRIPPPTEQIKDLPLIGEGIYNIWSQATSNLETTLKPILPQIKSTATSLLGAFASFGVTILKFLFSSIIAGVMLAYADPAISAATSTSNRIDEVHGREFLQDAVTTVRNVAKGILGVAVIQAFLAGVGFAVIGVPAAGLWTMLCLIFAIIQVGTAPVMIPMVIYVFASKSMVTAVLFLLWGIFVTMLDSLLKPILLAKGAPVPMLIIFLGAIGGFINHGIIGLFVGAVVLSLAYKLLLVWLNTQPKTSVANKTAV